MRWFEWVIASLATSVLGHMALSEWAFHFVERFRQDPSLATKFVSSYPMRMAYRYSAWFVNSTTTKKLLKMALGVLWMLPRTGPGRIPPATSSASTTLRR
jgi:hypothetical protein